MTTELPPNKIPEPVNLPSQILVLDKVYYRPAGGDPINYSRDYGIVIESDEQPYSRDMKCDEKWLKVDFMWIKEPGLILITNLENAYKERHPSKEELEEVEKRILEIAFIKKPVVEILKRTMHDAPREAVNPVCDIPVPPRRSIRIYLNESKDLWIRSAHGIIKYSLTVFPSR